MREIVKKRTLLSFMNMIFTKYIHLDEYCEIVATFFLIFNFLPFFEDLEGQNCLFLAISSGTGGSQVQIYISQKADIICMHTKQHIFVGKIIFTWYSGNFFELQGIKDGQMSCMPKKFHRNQKNFSFRIIFLKYLSYIL